LDLAGNASLFLPTWLNGIHFIPYTPETSRVKTAAGLENLPLFFAPSGRTTQKTEDSGTQSGILANSPNLYHFLPGTQNIQQLR